MLPALSKAEVVFTAGLILSFLEMNGLVDSSQHNANIDAMQQLVGGAMFAITVISWVVQHVILVKHTTPAGQPVVEQKFSFQPVLTFLSTIFTKPVTSVNTANTVIDQPTP
jgi:hypothetical protein